MISAEKARLIKAVILDVDGVLTAGTLEEYLPEHPSPFPQLTVTERPDRFALELLEGRAGPGCWWTGCPWDS